MGADTAIFRMRRSKTGDSGPKPVKDEAAIALREWLAAAKINDGALFRRLWGPKVGERLSAHAIAAIVKRRAAQAGLPGDFAGHSLRRGFVTEAGLNDIPLAQTMAMTGHRLTKSVVRYSEVGDVLKLVVEQGTVHVLQKWTDLAGGRAAVLGLQSLAAIQFCAERISCSNPQTSGA